MQCIGYTILDIDRQHPDVHPLHLQVANELVEVLQQGKLRVFAFCETNE